MSPYFRHLPAWKNILIGSQLTDETFGVAVTKLTGRTEGSYRWMLGLNVTAYLNWLAANLAGGVFGHWIDSPEKYGLDFALPAMFIGLFMLQWLERSKFRWIWRSQAAPWRQPLPVRCSCPRAPVS